MDPRDALFTYVDSALRRSTRRGDFLRLEFRMFPNFLTAHCTVGRRIPSNQNQLRQYRRFDKTPSCDGQTDRQSRNQVPRQRRKTAISQGSRTDRRRYRPWEPQSSRQAVIVIHIILFRECCSRCRFQPCDCITSSASYSRFSPPSNFVDGHVSTVWFVVCRWPQSQEGDWARPHLCT